MTRVDLYLRALRQWEQTATPDERIDLKNYPAAPACIVNGEEVAQVGEDGEIILTVGHLSSEQALKLAAFMEDVYAEARVAYDPALGDDRLCQCGHTYRRHFDTYDGMRDVGCKYCECSRWSAADHPSQEKMEAER